MSCIETIEITVQQALSQNRYTHCKSVSEFSLILCRIYASQLLLNKEQIILASLFHDYCREWSCDQLIAYTKEHQLECEREELDYPVLLHALVASSIAKDFTCLQDQSIIDAIRWHTLGSPSMGKLGAILYCSDYMEPNRTYMNSAIIDRLLTNTTLESLLHSVIEHHIHHMRESGRTIAATTASLYEYLRKGGAIQ